jgi:hypothetical protein
MISQTITQMQNQQMNSSYQQNSLYRQGFAAGRVALTNMLNTLNANTSFEPVNLLQVLIDREPTWKHIKASHIRSGLIGFIEYAVLSPTSRYTTRPADDRFYGDGDVQWASNTTVGGYGAYGSSTLGTSIGINPISVYSSANHNQQFFSEADETIFQLKVHILAMGIVCEMSNALHRISMLTAMLHEDKLAINKDHDIDIDKVLPPVAENLNTPLGTHFKYSHDLSESHTDLFQTKSFNVDKSKDEES